jgi:hypothetical protein
MIPFVEQLCHLIRWRHRCVHVIVSSKRLLVVGRHLVCFIGITLITRRPEDPPEPLPEGLTSFLRHASSSVPQTETLATWSIGSAKVWRRRSRFGWIAPQHLYQSEQAPSVEISADRWPDHIRLSDNEPRFVCTACGKRGAELRPKFSQARMGTGLVPWSARRRWSAAGAGPTQLNAPRLVAPRDRACGNRA